MAQTVFGVLDQNISDEITRISETLENGSCDSYEDYKYLAGRIRGLRTAQEFVVDLRQKLEDDNE